jgi:hypothetical protein
MRGVSVDGALKHSVATSAALPPSAPVKATVSRPSSLATSNARMTFMELPLVVRPMATSPALPRPRSWREKMSS